MDKNILQEYIDACELIKETESDIKKLRKKKKTIIQTNVTGSNPDFPYQSQHFQIQGTTFTVRDESRLQHEEKLLEERKANAEQIKRDVDAYMNTLPVRMQRIVKYRFLEGLEWEQIAIKMGRKATKDSVRKEFERFMKMED